VQLAQVSSNRPVLLVAAESIALSSHARETVEDVVFHRALKHYVEGLRQYFALRLGSLAAAEQALAALRTRLSGFSGGALVSGLGPRAHLYRIAREIAEERRSRTTGRRDELTFMAPAENAPPSYVTALSRVRKELASQETELLELRYARELSPEELAYVLTSSVEDVVTRLELAATHAAAILGKAPPSRLGGLRGALQEAFALSPAEDALRENTRGLPKGTVIAERYAIAERVGEGSFGDVYRALDTDVPGHVVALKLLHKPATSEEARKSALRELRLIASVFHPSVVDFKDHGWYQDRLWFVMPWYEGETLEERIKRAPLTREEALDIFTPLAQALATMHAAGIRHQDIKPDNIFLARIGEAESERQRILPVLIDLGVAAKEAEMIVAGTPLYFPPEIAAQYANKPEKPAVTAKADVFSLALALRNALEPSSQEEVPGTAIEAFIAHRADHPPKPPRDKRLRYLAPYFARWLAHDPNLRPSAESFVEELSVLTRPERERERQRAVLRWAAPIALGSLLGLSSITFVYLKKRDEAMAASLRADVTEGKLGRESARRMRLEESYQHSELTRQQLEDRLTDRSQEATRLGGQLGHTRRELTDLTGRMHALAAELEAQRRERESALRKLAGSEARASVLEGQLFNAEQKRAFVESEVREARMRMNAAENEVDELRGRARVLLGELDRARDEASTQLGRAADLEQSLSATRQERLRLQSELDAERRRAGDLEARLPGPNQPGVP
jgi:eukaryotic-like serine/threonine-protein kinase